MGKKLKIIFSIVLFPITLFILLIKGIIKIIEVMSYKNFLKNISINKIDTLDGQAFEEVMFRIFKSAKLKVEKTPKSRDYGADLIITTKYEKIVIQCKLYFNHKVGNSAIQEVNTAKNYYNATLGLVITNSYFTTPAQNLAEVNKVKLMDRDKLIELLDSDNKDKKNIIETM